LAATFDVEVLAVFVMKISAKKYKIFVKPLDRSEVYSPSTKKGKIENLVFSYVQELENIVKQYPLQWFNFYEFWKVV